jgi:hypothetical protein
MQSATGLPQLSSATCKIIFTSKINNLADIYSVTFLKNPAVHISAVNGG